ncbi:MAG: S-layer homology domain-containing protein [Oscillospiraceae bacterium]|jgi:uncharacterized repeat protein (TIGR02543 family)|nr:S-layer homology domain-containing protein [Oscillospiraceae bacterium]
MFLFYIIAAAAIMFLFIRGSIFIYKTIRGHSRIGWRNIIPWTIWAVIVLTVVAMTCYFAFQKLLEDGAKLTASSGGTYYDVGREKKPIPTLPPTFVTSGKSGAKSQYLLTFAGGGTGGLQPIYVNAGELYVLPMPPERENSVFSGWFADGAHTHRVTEVKMDADKTVYAAWIPKSNKPMHAPYLVADSDGYFHPSDGVTRRDILVMFSLMVDYTEEDIGESTFSDSPEDIGQYRVVLNKMRKLGIVSGFEDNTFRPEEQISRLEFISICVRMVDYTDEKAGAKRPVTGSSSWVRADDKHWAADAVNRAAKWGWLEYYRATGTAIFPDGKMTRMEIATIINRMLGRNCDKDYLKRNPTKYKDVSETMWAYYDILESSILHIVQTSE